MITTPEGWSILEDDTGYGALVRLKGRIDCDLGEMPTHEYIRPYVKAGATVIDVGAHIGSFTVPMQEWVGASGKVLAFEPMPELFECLRRNVGRASYRNAELYQVALGNQNGKVTFGRNKLNYGACSMVNPMGEPVEVWCRSLDELYVGAPISFMKIDCEGAEIDVLRGARQLLTMCRPVLFIETNSYAFKARGITQADLIHEIVELGYPRIRYFPEAWVKRGLQPHDLLALPR